MRSKPRRITAKVRQQRATRLTQLFELLPISGAVADPPDRFLFFDLGSRDDGLVIDHAYEDLDDARWGYRGRGDADFDPNPPPNMVVDLDADDLAVTAVSHCLCGDIDLAEEFLLEAWLVEEYESAPGDHWSAAYYDPAPRVHPDLSPPERAIQLRAWLESGRWDGDRDEWTPETEQATDLGR